MIHQIHDFLEIHGEAGKGQVKATAKPLAKSAKSPRSLQVGRASRLHRFPALTFLPVSTAATCIQPRFEASHFGPSAYTLYYGRAYYGSESFRIDWDSHDSVGFRRILPPTEQSYATINEQKFKRDSTGSLHLSSIYASETSTATMLRAVTTSASAMDGYGMRRGYDHFRD